MTAITIVLIFDYLDYHKQLKIAGVISDIEYQLNIFIDYILFTTTGHKSLEYIRQNQNPIFIAHAIDKGVYYARV
jgi:hypothetical protein